MDGPKKAQWIPVTLRFSGSGMIRVEGNGIHESVIQRRLKTKPPHRGGDSTKYHRSGWINPESSHNSGVDGPNEVQTLPSGSQLPA